jgi:hypothetical protein
LKGGFALNKSGFNPEIIVSIGIAIFLAVSIPLMGYNILKRYLSKLDASAIAATYGSVSAVTFITTTQVLDQYGISFGGYMAAAMALMESPAIIIAIILANNARQKVTSIETPKIPMSKVLHESITDGGQLLLIGSLVIGLLSGDAGHKVMAPFSIDLFKGLLAFFLLDMGILAAKNIGELKNKPLISFLYALIAPLVHASIALALCHTFHVPLGNTVLLMVLAASASYIAVPAVLRHAMPEVNPALYMGMSLGITFPFNIILGIPLNIFIAKLFV